MLFGPNKKKIKRRREALCAEADIFIQVHFVRERNNERYKFNTLKLKNDPIREKVEEWYSANGNPETFSETVMIYINEKHFDEKNFANKCNFEPDYFSKIKSNHMYVPSKGEALTVAFGLKLNFEETKALLRTADYAISNSEKEDLIVRFFLENNDHNINDLNYVLYHFCEKKIKDIV